MNNQFLSSFMQMRQGIASKVAKVEEKKQSKSLKPLPDVNDGITLATIIETKPSKSEVIKYLERRRDKLINDIENGSDSD